MAFPETRHTLIERLATRGDEADWAVFVRDYWGPVCRFAAGRSGLTAEDAEDVASMTFEVILRKELLGEWVTNRSAKLRTLLCVVVRNLISNHVRVRDGRARLLREQADRFDERFVLRSLEVGQEEEAAFQETWAADVIQQAMNDVMTECHASGRGDWFRVLYGRLCDGLTIRETAEHLGISQSSCDNYFRAVREQLQRRLESIVRSRVERYSRPEDVADEFRAEWEDLADHLHRHGGLESSVEQAFRQSEHAWDASSRQASVQRTITRISGVMRMKPADPGESSSS